MPSRPSETRAAFGELFDRYSGLSGSFRLGVDGPDYAKGRTAGRLEQIDTSWATVTEKARTDGVSLSTR